LQILGDSQVLTDTVKEQHKQHFFTAVSAVFLQQNHGDILLSFYRYSLSFLVCKNIEKCCNRYHFTAEKNISAYTSYFPCIVLLSPLAGNRNASMYYQLQQFTMPPLLYHTFLQLVKYISLGSIVKKRLPP